ncbi:DUF952 domain-containing protein [Streptosporangiaceae bacterium NEAU-GS5]|nr:DUF952 domain-containing protein [Streptosporangiaceae bacterium NEAU-GS5]
MIFHLALASDWAQAQQSGEYRISTIGRTLDEEGFIHASADLAQASRVAGRFYRDVDEPLVLLTIDESRVGAPVIHEPATSPANAGPAAGTEAGELFPHIYGPLPVTAVVAVTAYTP